MRLLLWLIASIVPRSDRARWREEWRAELQHGNRRMILGALPDAWTLRRLASGSRLTGADRRRHPFHAIDQDVRFALRGFGKGKGFSLALVGSLAIGIGATTAAFALVNATFFRPIAQIHAEEELVRATIGWGARGAYTSTTWDDYEVLRDGISAIADLSISHPARFAVAPQAGGEPRRLQGQVVSSNYFDVLGVRPALGRFFAPEEDAAPWAHPAVVISHRYWERHLAGDQAVLGRALNVNGTDLPVIGVAPRGFEVGNAPQVWITFALSDLTFRDSAGQPIHARYAAPFHSNFIGRLKAGATIDQARAQAAGLASPLARMRDRGSRQLVVRVDSMRIDEPAVIGLQALALMIIPAVVLAIACVNAANLLLARATTQSADWLTRLALGASRWRLIRQVLVESMLLALAGSLLGLLIASWATAFFERTSSLEVVIDARVMLFALLAAIATAFTFGLGPALTVSRTAIARAPEAGRFLRGPFGSRTRSALVVLQAALCLGLLATSALFTRAIQEMWDDGLPEPSQFLATSFDLDQLRYTPPQAEAFYADLLRRVEELPAIHAAALTDRSIPGMLAGGVTSSGTNVSIPGQTEMKGAVSTYASAEFFDAMGLEITQGRTFSSDEHRGLPTVVVVNEDFVKRAFGENPLGRTVTLVTGEDDKRIAVDAMVIGVI
jgi:predicted permease